MIRHANVQEIADLVWQLSEQVNQTACPLGESPSRFGRDMAVARTHLQTAALWLEKAGTVSEDNAGEKPRPGQGI